MNLATCGAGRSYSAGASASHIGSNLLGQDFETGVAAQSVAAVASVTKNGSYRPLGARVEPRLGCDVTGRNSAQRDLSLLRNAPSMVENAIPNLMTQHAALSCPCRVTQRRRRALIRVPPTPGRGAGSLARFTQTNASPCVFTADKVATPWRKRGSCISQAARHGPSAWNLTTHKVDRVSPNRQALGSRCYRGSSLCCNCR